MTTSAILLACVALAAGYSAPGYYEPSPTPPPYTPPAPTPAPYTPPAPTPAPYTPPAPTPAPYTPPAPTPAPYTPPAPTPAPYTPPAPAPYKPTPPPYTPKPNPGVYPEPDKPTHPSKCDCFEKGNYYTPISADECRSFTQRTAFLPPETQHCPAGLKFDLATCVCNWPEFVTCPDYCPGAHEEKGTYNTCEQNGNVYRQVPNTYCSQFTQETATLPPQVHTCPAGLQFDLKTCVCNYPADTVCHV